MSEYPQIDRIKDRRHPDRDEYQRYIDVWFDNGVLLRHVVDKHGDYYEQVFPVDDHDTVWDDMLIEQEFDPDDLDEYVVTWLDVTTDALLEGDDTWECEMITMSRRSSPTNVRYE